MIVRKRQLANLLPILVLVLSVLTFFIPVLGSGKPLFGSDFVSYFYPLKKFIYQHLHIHGSLPLWNVHQFSGTPVSGNIQASMFYPLGFLFYLIPPEQAYGYTIMLHCALAAVFMYIFAHSLPMTKVGASISALMFSYNGFFMGHVFAGHLTFVQSYIWIPLVFLHLKNFVVSLRIKDAVLCGVLLGIQLLGGFPQIVFYTVLAILLLGGYHVGKAAREGQREKTKNLIGGILIIGVFSMALAAIQVLPTYQFSQLSTRSGGVSYEFATIDSFDPVNFITFLIPNFFGTPLNGSYWKSAEVWQFWELCAYVGIGPLLLICFLEKNASTRHIRPFFVLLTLLSLFLALGRYNPLYRFIHYLPGFNHFRVPAQILYLYVFSMSVLSGMGLDILSRSRSYSPYYKLLVLVAALFFAVLIILLSVSPASFFQYVFMVASPPEITLEHIARVYETLRLSLFTTAGFFVLFIVLIHLGCKRVIGSTPLISALLLVTVADLWCFAHPLVRNSNPEPSPGKSALLQSLAPGKEAFRVVTDDSLYRPNDGLLYGYHDIQGYDPLILKRYLEYINKSQNMNTPPDAVNVQYVRNLNNPLIKMLNVKYAISNGTGVFTLQGHLPRAYMVPRARTMPKEQILDHMMAADFNPLEIVIFEPEYQPFLLDEETCDSVEASCSVIHYSTDRIRIRTSANQAGYLVLSEVFYPGWETRVDCEKTPLLCGNYIFRVVPLEPGDHEVDLRFVSWPFRIGALVSLLTLAISLWIIVVKRDKTEP
jgi:hypothetical protein